ncbi:MAG: ASPIC/UnbV domain-containing protein, partial [Gammaproteobacteria bacterium]
VSPVRSYLSQTEATLTFGIGAAERIERLEVTFPDGAVQRFDNIRPRQELVVTEASGAVPPGS